MKGAGNCWKCEEGKAELKENEGIEQGEYRIEVCEITKKGKNGFLGTFCSLTDLKKWIEANFND